MSETTTTPAQVPARNAYREATMNSWKKARPIQALYELTYRCNHLCTFCNNPLSRHGSELSTEEALRVVSELAAMRTREVVLIGGEAYLHEGFLEIARALKAAGIRPTMTTGGRGVTDALAVDMAEAGIAQVSVSIDGLEPAHDRMRNLKGSFASATAALTSLRNAGIPIAANTNLNRLNRDDLERLYEHLSKHGITAWQVQITTPLGRAADRTMMVLQPFDLIDLVPRIAALKERAWRDGILLMPGNNLGYFGPEEAKLRSSDPSHRDHWSGCQAGRFVMGIESDGAVKGCPSLQTDSYVGGKARDQSIASIWNEAPELAFTRARTENDLWGYCRECPFASVCLAGCSFTAHAVLGRPGNNPYCHFRARQFASQGLRERLVAGAPASGKPFDNGLFELVVEAFDAPDPGANLSAERLVQIDRKPKAASPGD